MKLCASVKSFREQIERIVAAKRGYVGKQTVLFTCEALK